MTSCCVLGAKLDDRVHVLYETDHFFVAPAQGSVGIEGYVLVLSKECARGTGDIPERDHAELLEVVAHTRRIVQEQYGSVPYVFEHGPRIGKFRGGGCLDHAHLHVVPGVDVTDELAADLLHRLEEADRSYKVTRSDRLQRLADIYHRGESSYLFVETPDDAPFMVEVDFALPSQYIRRLIARRTGSETWNWRKHPEHEIFERTVTRLQGRF